MIGGLTISGFLSHSQELLEGVDSHELTKERILPYRYDAERIALYLELYGTASELEASKTKKFGKQMATYIISDQLWLEASEMQIEHFDLLRRVVRDDKKQQKRIFAGGLPDRRKKNKFQKEVLNCYKRIMEDEEVMAGLDYFGVTVEKLEAAVQKYKDWRTARILYNKQCGDTQDTIEARNRTFLELHNALLDLKTVCRHALKDHKKILINLGVLKPPASTSKKDEEPGDTGTTGTGTTGTGTTGTGTTGTGTTGTGTTGTGTTGTTGTGTTGTGTDGTGTDGTTGTGSGETSASHTLDAGGTAVTVNVGTTRSESVSRATEALGAEETDEENGVVTHDHGDIDDDMVMVPPQQEMIDENGKIYTVK